MGKVIIELGNDISTDDIYPGRFMATVLSGAQCVEGFARRLFVLVGGRHQLLHGLQGGGYVHPLSAQALYRVGAGLFHCLACFDGCVQRGLGCIGGGLQCCVCCLSCGIHHRVVARGLRTQELTACPIHFGQRAFKLATALGVGAAVSHGA